MRSFCLLGVLCLDARLRSFDEEPGLTVVLLNIAHAHRLFEDECSVDLDRYPVSDGESWSSPHFGYRCLVVRRQREFDIT